MKDFIKKGYVRYRIAIWLLATVLILYTTFGFLIAPVIIRRVAQSRLTGLLHRQVTIQGVRLNPYALSVTIQGVAIAGKEQSPLITVRRLYANAQLMSLPRRGLVLKAIEIDGPEIHVVRQADQRFNFSDLIPPQNEAAPAVEPAGAPPRIILGRISLNEGRIHFTDRAADGPFATQWRGIRLLLENIDTKSGAAPALFQITAASDGGERLSVNGQAAAAPLAARADVRLDGVAIAKYAPYYRPFFKPMITSGTLNLNASVHWTGGAGRIGPMSLQCLDLRIEEAPQRPMLAIGRFELTDAALDMDQHTLALGTTTTRDGKVWLCRDGQGRLNWLDAVTVSEDEAPRQPPPAAEEKAAWQVVVPGFRMENYSVSLTDLQPDPPAQVDLNQIAISAENLGNRQEQPGKAALKFLWSDQGAFSALGTVRLAPLEAELAIDATDMDLRPAQPYINEHLQLTVTSGKIGTKGILRIVPVPDGAPDIQYAGQAALNDFQTVDSVKTSDFVTWKSLFLSGLAVGTAPFRLTIDQVSLTDFFNRLIVHADGTTNLGTIFKRRTRPGDGTGAAAENQAAATPKGPPAEGVDKAPAPDIRINTVTLQGGQVDFRDQLVKPNVRVTLNDVGGRISGLAAVREKKADVLLRGNTPSKIPFEISGQVNPLIEKPFVDLKIVFTGIDLSQYTPYSAKYLGYELDKGQLSLSLAYFLENNQLKGQNKVAINQLTFGDTVASPTATKLPVKLAVALLKDRQGNINLDLPVEGSVDDPQFSMGGIILTMLGNLVVEIVSSPFKLLGAMFGSGEELQYLAFEAGKAEIPPAGAEKLAVLAKALTERPALNLDIQGQVDPDTDTNALRQAQFELQLKAAELKSMRRAVPLDQIVVSPEERERLIKRAYKEAEFPKPRDEKGDFKKLEPAEMEKLLVTAIEITPDALRQLAYERALNAKNHLVAQGGIAAGRLFVVEPDLTGGAAPEQQKSRVQFKVK